MTINEILGILGYVAAYLAVGLGLSPLAVRVERGITASAMGDDPPPRPDPRVIGFFVVLWPGTVIVWASYRACLAAIGLVTGLGWLACWLSRAEGERAAGGAEET